MTRCWNGGPIRPPGVWRPGRPDGLAPRGGARWHVRADEAALAGPASGSAACSGTAFEAIAGHLRRSRPGGFAVDEVRECVCRSCTGTRFKVSLMARERAVRRSCLGCHRSAFIADSADHWDDTAGVERCACSCGGDAFAAAAGFSLDGNGDVRWVSVGLCCAACGSLGVYEDWKIGYAPSAGLLDQV